MLKLHVDQIEAIEAALATLEQRLTRGARPFRAAVDLLKTIPGISDTVAAVILAEVGDRHRPVSHRRASGLVGRLLPPTRRECRQAAVHTHPAERAVAENDPRASRLGARRAPEDSYFHAQFARLKSRRGPKKAIMAVAASMVTAIYYMLRNGVEFEDLGAQHFVHHDKDQITKRLLRRLHDLGVEVEIKNAA